MFTASRIWRTVGLVSAAATLMLLFGFLYAVRDVIYPGTENQQSYVMEDHAYAAPEQSSPLDVTVIGDSLAKGTGDDMGSGFAKRTVELLTKQGASSKLINNLGINGLTTKELLPMLDQHGVQYSLGQAGIILLSIGANDLFDGEEPLETRTELPTEAELEQSVKSASDNLIKILDKIRNINPQAQLVYVSLYNPFSDMKELKETGDQAVARWNGIAAEAMASIEGGLIVPTFDLFTLQAGRYLSGDHFHPNATGYQAIADRIVQGIAVKE
ncbi:lysophospholipase L1-like esterase [Fontibacillus phaseoli]|uniref:Lysophospholipase L1-like esterase n=1 Tax=Fontibacillus phaseoli TaxID=1416533 RepID=A0A369BS12_9BACL|nr:GDSL-type esterase/lipase family protein [Fontibacillus phaseoli]RCX23386.1 lysophospholipase L1-like esterase [Fontibacillus phaseoli]